jgi:hypothetical protein
VGWRSTPAAKIDETPMRLTYRGWMAIEALIYLWTRDVSIPPEDIAEYVKERFNIREMPGTYSDEERIAAVRTSLKGLS